MNRPTHPIKELEILLNAGVFHLDSSSHRQCDEATSNACECLRDAKETLDAYFDQLGFDNSGDPPPELAEAERLIAIRLKKGPA